MKNEAIYRHKTGNDLVTELVLFYAFFCAFPSHKGSKSMKYGKVNQRVTLVCIIWVK